MAEKKVKIKITSAIAVEGQIIKPDQEITVSEAVAKNLLNRGRAELAEKPDTKPLKSMTVAELKDYAFDRDIDVDEDMKKAELIDAIEAAEAE